MGHTRPYISLHSARMFATFFYTRATQRRLCPGWSHISSLFSPAKRYCSSSAHALCLYYFLGVGSFSLWCALAPTQHSLAHGGRRPAVSNVDICERDDVIFHKKAQVMGAAKELSWQRGQQEAALGLLCCVVKYFASLPMKHQPDRQPGIQARRTPFDDFRKFIWLSRRRGLLHWKSPNGGSFWKDLKANDSSEWVEPLHLCAPDWKQLHT